MAPQLSSSDNPLPYQCKEQLVRTAGAGGDPDASAAHPGSEQREAAPARPEGADAAAPNPAASNDPFYKTTAL